MKGLIIRDPWITRILDGDKTWEMRSKPTLYRGRMALVRKATGMAFGTAELADSLPPLNAESFCAARARHGIPANMDAAVLRDGWIYPWVLRDVRRLWSPVIVGQKSGAVIWVTLTPDVILSIEKHRMPLGSAVSGGAA